SCLIHISKRCELIHNLFSSSYSACCKSSSNDFAKASEIWADRVNPLCSLSGETKACDHLIKNKKTSCLCGFFSKLMKKKRGGCAHTHISRYRLYNRAGYLLFLFLEKCF